MVDETRKLAFGTTYDMAAAQNACGQLLSLTAHRPNDKFPPHRHSNDYLCMVLKGGFIEVQGNGCHERKAGTFFVHEAGETHFDQIGSLGATCLNVHFESEGCPPFRVEGAFSTLGRLAADRLAFELCSSCGDELQIASLSAEIIDDVRAPRARPPDRSNWWLTKVVEAISDEPTRRWKLRELAQIAERHPVHLAQAFRGRTGMSLGDFQRLRRLTSLILALRKGSVPLAALAHEFGYCDQSHMNAEFRAACGTSPGKFRRSSH